MTQFKIITTELIPGKFWDFPPIQLSEDEIFEFARLCDPQKIHLDKIAAEQSIFGGLIASGLQPYVWFHKKYWVFATEDHFICGISFEGVNFFKPVYPNIPFKGRLSIMNTIPKIEKNTILVSWKVEILSMEDILIHEIKFTSYHRNN